MTVLDTVSLAGSTALATGHYGLGEVDSALRSTTEPGVLTSIVNPQEA